MSDADADVMDVTATAALTALVDAILPDDYLRVRSNSPFEAERKRFLAAAEPILMVWDRLAAIINQTGDEQRTGMTSIASVVCLTDMAARLAAYLALSGPLLPAARRALHTREPITLSSTLEGIRERARRRVSKNALTRATGLDRKTLTNTLKGNGTPNEDTLVALAKGLATFSIQEADGVAGVSEILLELRVACVLEAVHAVAEHSVLAGAIERAVRLARFYTDDLRRYSKEDLTEIIRAGTRWPGWLEVHDRTTPLLLQELAPTVKEMQRQADDWYAKVEQAFQRSASEGFRAAAEHERAMAQQTREMMSIVPGWERTIAGDLVRFYEGHAELWLALAEGREPPMPPKSHDTMKAKALCDTALAPSANLSLDQKREHYERALELDPTCAWVQFRAAMFFATNGNVDRALRHLCTAVALDESYDEAREALAGALLAKGRFEDALQHADVLDVHRGKTVGGLCIRGAAFAGLDRLEDAKAAFSGALEISERAVAAHVGLSDALRRLGDDRGAEHHDRRARLFAGMRSPTAP